ncbi:MAG TPA: AAA family ATPase, partial [Kofleriaceae bacterium]|nr:AAA family ATPase [Kofleriaceae bacterium]
QHERSKRGGKEVERRDAHKGAVLLLDEPGLSLPPLSQRDLSAFFESLSETNPIIYTTHSPFMVDQDHVDRVRGVYVDAAGATAVSADLRAASTTTAQGKSVYAVHAALGLSVSEALMQGCSNVIVEGPSDQYYLSAMKTVLVGRRRISPKRELLFLPGGGAKGVNALVPVVAAKDDDLPVVLLDDDGQGRQFADALRRNALYSGAKERVLSVREFVSFDHAEIEDLLAPIVAEVASREFRGSDDDFNDVFVSTSPIVPQIEDFAARNGISLEHGWKVGLSRKVKQRMLRDLEKHPDSMLDEWARLFARFEPSVKA